MQPWVGGGGGQLGIARETRFYVRFTCIKGKQQHFFTGLLIRTFKITVTSVVNFLITCLVSEILKDKRGQSH